MPANPFDQALRWWSAQLNWAHTPTLWALASFAVAVIGSNLLWMVCQSRRRPAQHLASWLATLPGQGLLWLARVAWLIGPGYAALLAGAASPRLMGLSQIDWGSGLGWGVGFAALALAVLLAGGLSYRRSQSPAAPGAAPWPSLSAAIAGSALLFFEAGAFQFQWAFYRSAAIEGAANLGAPNPVMAGVWLAVVIIGLQALLSPWFWRDLRTPDLAGRQVLRAALLLTTSVVYLLSRNFWLAWVLHASAVVLLEPRLTPHPALARWKLRN